MLRRQFLRSIPLAAAEQRDIAVPLARGRIEPEPEGRRHDDDVVFARVHAIGDGPIDRRVIVNVDVGINNRDVLVTHVSCRAAPHCIRNLFRLSTIALIDRDEQIDAGMNGRAPHVGDAGHAGAVEHVPRG